MRRVDADEHEAVCAERDALKAEVARLTERNVKAERVWTGTIQPGPEGIECDIIPEPPKNKHADKIADKSWRDYDSEPDGLEEV